MRYSTTVVSGSERLFELECSGQALALDELLVLNALLTEGRLTVQAVGRLIQKGTRVGEAVLAKLQDRGLSQPRGFGSGEAYLLSKATNRRLGTYGKSTRAGGLESAQQEEVVTAYLREHGRITRAEARELCQQNGSHASRLLAKLAKRRPEIQLRGR